MYLLIPHMFNTKPPTIEIKIGWLSSQTVQWNMFMPIEPLFFLSENKDKLQHFD